MFQIMSLYLVIVNLYNSDRSENEYARKILIDFAIDFKIQVCVTPVHLFVCVNI